MALVPSSDFYFVQVHPLGELIQVSNCIDIDVDVSGEVPGGLVAFDMTAELSEMSCAGNGPKTPTRAGLSCTAEV